jgi:hypothetical protein
MAITNTLLIHEIISKAAAAKTRAEKIKVFHDNDTWALKDVLRGAYDPSVEWNLPEGSPPYEAAEEGTTPSNLLRRNVDFTYFVKGGQGDELPAYKRERMFIRLLEQIHPSDAAIVLLMKDKKTLAKGITKKLVEEAYPKLIRE